MSLKNELLKAKTRIAPMLGVRHSEKRALAWILPHMRESGWLKTITLRQALDHAGNPTPWLSYAAIHFLSQRMRPEFTVFEYGSGNSTLWWASHAKSVVSVEHNRAWYDTVKPKLPENVQYFHETVEGGQYPGVIDRFEPFDVIMIDGRERVECSRHAIGKLTAAGVVVFDNSERERYAEALDHFASHGFRRLDFVSMGPISQKPISTSVIYRDGNCFNI